MLLFTANQLKRLLKNGEPQNRGKDYMPVVKWFTPDANATWLITEIDPDGYAFGLCDLGTGTPELGYIRLQDLRTIRGSLGLPVERDMSFRAVHNLSVYAEAAKEQITEDPDALRQASYRVLERGAQICTARVPQERPALPVEHHELPKGSFCNFLHDTEQSYQSPQS